MPTFRRQATWNYNQQYRVSLAVVKAPLFTTATVSDGAATATAAAAAAAATAAATAATAATAAAAAAAAPVTYISQSDTTMPQKIRAVSMRHSYTKMSLYFGTERRNPTRVDEAARNS